MILPQREKGSRSWATTHIRGHANLVTVQALRSRQPHGATATQRSLAPPRLPRLSGHARHSVLTIHIAASVTLLGTTAGLLTSSAYASQQDAQDAHAIYTLCRLLVFSLDVPLSLIALVSGAWLALASRWGLLRTWWVTLKLALLLGTIVLGATMTGRALTTLLSAAGHGTTSNAHWLLLAAATCQLAILLVATILSVFKPFGRIRSRQAPLLASDPRYR
jgi:hypothetical protein